MTDALPVQAIFHFGPFSLEVDNARLLRDGQALDLVPKDLDLLSVLVQGHGRLLTKDDLLDAVWQRRFVSESVLKSGISRLRTALGDDARQPRYIETAQRRGYRFIAPVRTAVVMPSAESASHAAPEPAPAAWVDRPAATAWLQAQLDAVQAGATRIALLAGEAGIGKTSLVEHFMQHVAARELARVAAGQCVEQTAAIEPYLPALDAMNALCRGAAGSALVPLLRNVAPGWLLQLPWLVPADERLALQRETAGTTQDRMLRECGEFFDRATVDAPLLLVIEDLHWSDPATLQLVGYLARRRGTARLLVLATVRRAEMIASDLPSRAWHQALREHHLCEEFNLERFSESETAHFLAQRLPAHNWSDDAVRRLHAQTTGLPLFLAAMADEWSSGGEPAGQAGVPRSIFKLIERQHDRLTETQRQWLEVAAVAGVEFVHLPVARALAVDADALKRGFDALVRQRLWLHALGAVHLPDGRVGARYGFRHAVYRQVLYALTDETGRVQWHRRLAAALLDDGGDEAADVSASVAMHFERGQAPMQAAEHLARAGQRALQRFAPTEAADIARHALALLTSLTERGATLGTEVTLHVVLGVALSTLEGAASLASSQAFHDALRLMDGLPSVATRVPVLYGVWWSALVRGEIPRARDMAIRVGALGQQRDDASLQFAATAALGITLTHAGEFDAARDHLLQALASLQAHAGQALAAMFVFDPVVQLGGCLADALWWLGQAEAAKHRSAHALAHAEAAKHPPSLLLALTQAAQLHVHAGEFDDALALGQRAQQLAGLHQLAHGVGACVWVQGRARTALGELEPGLAQMREGLRLQQADGLVYGQTRWYVWFARASLDADRLDEAGTALQNGLALARSTGEQADLSALHRLHGVWLLRQGRPAEAQTAWQAAIEVARRQGAVTLERAARDAAGR
jgi:DNA-binding winged helix-turn-helix (wHTH) protein/tetratricopeptide (TPR) repeat protein